MAFRLDKLTVKSQEAVQRAQSLASEKGHPEMDRRPQVSGGSQPNANRQLMAVLEAALKEAAAMKDEFVSVEHLLLALTKTDSAAKNLLQVNGVREKDILEALKSVRGSARVSDQNPEGQYQALQKYGIDLVQKA